MERKRRRDDPHDPVRIVMSCPRCAEVELHAEPYGPVEARRCIRCDGVWLDEGRLRELLLSPPREELGSAPPPLRPPDAVRRPVRCPHCGKEMDRFEYRQDSGVHLDKCTGHGTWFDRGELEHVERLARAQIPRSRGGVIEFLKRLFGSEEAGA